VIGTHVPGLAEARALAAHRIPVIGIDERMRNHTSYSKAFSAVVITPRFNQPELIDDLSDLAAELERKPVLFITGDEQVKIIAEHGHRIRDLYLFDFPDVDTVRTLMSKAAFTQLAIEQGWRIPRTDTVDNRVDLETVAAELGYPVILKPRIKNLASRTHTRQKAYRCSDWASLSAAYDDIAPWEPEVVVQQWIAGPDSEVFYSFHYFDRELRELATFTGHKIRQWVPEVGSTASSEPADAPEVTDTSRTILRKTQCYGFGSVEYKRDRRTGHFFITEPTVGRVNFQLGTALANGADLVSTAYRHLVGLPAPATTSPRSRRKWILVAADLKSARFYRSRGELTWRQYLTSIQGPKSFAVWRLTEFRMMRRGLATLVGRAARAIARRIGVRPGKEPTVGEP
jgi:predicted ATP-grasp superfamily ATP-dependent carboligase